MDAEIVLDQNDGLGVREVDVGQVFQDASVIHGGMAICDLDVAPAFERSKHHEEIGGAIARVLIIETGRASRFHRDRHARNGTANLFMMFAPLEGWRHVKVTDRHTAVDYARVLKDLADIHFAHAKTIILVQDNLSIHSKASLYEAFPAVEARRLVERFEWHYTPKHGSWLNLAESELGVLTSQCLDRRIPNKQILIDEIAAWEHDRNANHTKADWQFTTKNARIKLKHLYPAI